jgi:hypothetical protein
MTSQQISELLKQAADVSDTAVRQGTSGTSDLLIAIALPGLWEIAYQLAVHNEREAGSLELTPPEITEAATKFYRERPEGFEDCAFLDLTARQQRWWLMEARKTANAQPTAQEPTPEAK